MSQLPGATTRPTVALYGHRLQDPSGTGISRYARELIAALARSDPSPFRYTMASSPERRGPDGLPADLPYHHPPGPRRVLHASWSTLRRPRVDRFVGRPDLLHVLYPSTPVPTSAPTVSTIHDLIPLRHPEWFARYERWGFAHAVREAARRADALIAVSTVVAEEVTSLLEVSAERVHVVPLGVAPSFSVDPAPELVERVCGRHGVRPGGYFLVLGAVSTRKNLAPLLEAMANRRRTDALPLLAVGPLGVGGQEVVDLVSRRHLGDRVRLTGWLPSAEVVALLHGARGLLHPSVEEGFGMTPLEAMTCGVPSAVSRGGSLPEVVGDASILVETCDPDRWGDAMTGLADDETLRSRLIVRGRTRAATFTWERTAGSTTEVYRWVLGAQPTS